MEKNSAATAIIKMKHTIASKFCIHIVDVWCYCFPFYGPPCRRWIFFPDGISWNFDTFLLFLSHFNWNPTLKICDIQNETSYIHYQSFSILKLNQNSPQSQLRGVTRVCIMLAKGLHTEAKFLAPDRFSHFSWLTFYLKGVVQSL